MAKKDLEQYVRERLTALDPLLDTTSGSRADTEVVKPILDYFGADLFTTNIRTFLLDTLQRSYPKLGARQDGIIDDTLGKPVAALLDPVVREIGLLRRRQFVDPSVHTIDSARLLAGTLFMPIVDGGRSYGTGRLYYVAPVTEVIRPENVFYARNGSRFTPTGTQTITKDEMQLNLEDGLYYYDVRLAAVDPGVAGNIDVGVLDRAPSISRAVRVTNKMKFVGGTDGDTVDTILARAALYPTQLSLSVARGIKAIIDRNFEGLAKRVEVVGMGDPLMMRDIIRGGNYSGAIAFGSYGRFFPSATPALATNLFVSIGTDFEAILGSGVMTEDYYLMMHKFGTPGLFRTSRIAEVLGKTVLRLDDYVVPLGVFLQWSIHRKYITLSDVPGGITFPTGPGGTIEIKDDEIHVGGMTDTYVHEDLEQASTDLEAASDETAVDRGTDAQLGGDPAFAPPPVVKDQWIRLQDLADRRIFTTTYYQLIAPDTDHPGQQGIMVTAIRGVDDLSEIRSKPGYEGSGHALDRGLFSNPPADSWWSDIISINLDDGLEHRYRITDITVQDVGGGVYAYILWVDRLMALAVPLPGAQVRVVRVIPEGIDRGRSMLILTDPGPPAEDIPLRIYDFGSGWYYGAELDPRNYRAEALVRNETAFVPAGWRWSIIDRVDINLVDPKRLRVDGNDLVIASGSTTATTVSASDLETYGVKAEDILRITSGPLAGKEYQITDDPSGPGNSIVNLSEPMGASGTFKYEIYAPQTPISKPLSDGRMVSLLTSEGALSTGIPLGRPQGATSSQFSNAGIGLKWRNANAVTGAMARTPVGDSMSPALTVSFDPNNYLELWWISEQWGYYRVRFQANGPLNPGGYDFTLAADRVQFLIDFNATLPTVVLVYIDENGNINDGSGTGNLYLAAIPYDSDESTSFAPGLLLNFNGPTVYRLFENVIGVTPTAGVLTSRSVTFPYSTDVFLADKRAIAEWNDLVRVESGVNQNKAGVIALKTNWSSHHYYVLFPGVRLLPQRVVTARVGSPSVGYGRTFFDEPTLFEVFNPTRYYVEGTDAEYAPDPRMFGVIRPAYPETELPEGLHRDLATPQLLHLPVSAYELDIEPGDIIEPTNRLVWFTGHDFAAAPWVLGAASSLILTFEEGQVLTIPIPAATYVLGTPGPGQEDLLALINAITGETMAETLSVGGNDYLAIHTQRRILTFGGDLPGVGPTGIGPTSPATATTTGNLSALAQTGLRYIVLAIRAGDPTYVRTTQNIGSGETISGDGVQFRVLRLGHQRFSAQKISEKQHSNGLYYGDVELIGMGAGDEWNIEPNQSFRIEGYRALGYYLEPENDVLSLSMAEVPWLRMTPFVQDKAAVDRWGTVAEPGQTVVHGEPFRISYDRGNLVASLQALADSEDERENNESFLARCMYPCRVYLGVKYYGGPTETVARDSIADLITKQAEALDISEIVTLLIKLGATRVITPIEMAAVYLNQDRTTTAKVGQDRVEVSRTVGFTVGRLKVERLG